VNRSVPGDSVLSEARAIALQMAEIDPAVLASAKRALHFGAGHTVAEAMKNEQQESAALRAVRT
jgi:enoyl-CoA hydratase/carnithine racemase